MRSICFFALVLVLLSGPALSQEPAVTQARHPVWLEPCPEADSSDVEVLKARVDCLERRSEAMADSQNLLLQNMFLLLEEQFLNEPAKIVERIPAVVHEAKLLTAVSAFSDVSSSIRTWGGRRLTGISGARLQAMRLIYDGTSFSPPLTYRVVMSAVPQIVNCVPPLMEKSGFVLVGAKLSNWTDRQISAATAINQCIKDNNPDFALTYLGSRSRSEGCYVNRTWFDWYTRRAASEGWPMNDAALCRNAEKRFEETFADARLLISDRFDVWLDGDRLLYVKNGCADFEERFFLHLHPVDPDDLPEDRKQYGFENKDFNFSQARLGSMCVAARPLPDFPVVGIRTGQFIDTGRIWERTFSFTGDPVP